MGTPQSVAAASGAGLEPRYRPISQYAAIGDCRTAALVGPDGSIDWCCMPHFDSEAVFLRILDAERGGYFRVCPLSASASTMAYLTGTNVLNTDFTTPTGTLRLLDFMPVRPRHRGHDLADLGQELVSLLPGGPRSWVLERAAGNDLAAAHRINPLATCPLLTVA